MLKAHNTKHQAEAVHVVVVVVVRHNTKGHTRAKSKQNKTTTTRMLVHFHNFSNSCRRQNSLLLLHQKWEKRPTATANNKKVFALNWNFFINRRDRGGRRDLFSVRSTFFAVSRFCGVFLCVFIKHRFIRYNMPHAYLHTVFLVVECLRKEFMKKNQLHRHGCGELNEFMKLYGDIFVIYILDDTTDVVLYPHNSKTPNFFISYPILFNVLFDVLSPLRFIFGLGISSIRNSKKII